MYLQNGCTRIIITDCDSQCNWNGHHFLTRILKLDQNEIHFDDFDSCNRARHSLGLMTSFYTKKYFAFNLILIWNTFVYYNEYNTFAQHTHTHTPNKPFTLHTNIGTLITQSNNKTTRVADKLFRLTLNNIIREIWLWTKRSRPLSHLLEPFDLKFIWTEYKFLIQITQ